MDSKETQKIFGTNKYAAKGGKSKKRDRKEPQEAEVNERAIPHTPPPFLNTYGLSEEKIRMRLHGNKKY